MITWSSECPLFGTFLHSLKAEGPCHQVQGMEAWRHEQVHLRLLQCFSTVIVFGEEESEDQLDQRGPKIRS